MKTIIAIAITSITFFLIGVYYQDQKRDIDNRIQIQEFHLKKSELQYQKDLDRLHFEIKRQEMLDVYEGVRGFEKQYIFWDTVKFVKVEKQF